MGDAHPRGGELDLSAPARIEAMAIKMEMDLPTHCTYERQQKIGQILPGW